MRRIGVWADGSPEWHAAREGRIGGSDIGTICGWNQWETRAELLERKLGELAPRKESDAMLRGHCCEPAIQKWLELKHGIKVDDTRAGTYVGDEEWMAYNPDGISTDGLLLEYKTANARHPEDGWGRAGTDQVPLAYAAQVIWGMGILGLTECVMAVLAGANGQGVSLHFARYKIRFDPQVFTFLKTQATDFHNQMKAGTA